jgi:hypothetical protein
MPEGNAVITWGHLSKGDERSTGSMIDQTVWLAARATSYTVVCEECAAEHGYLGARVEGRLDLEREHTATCCSRGHPISVFRADRDLIGVPAG